MIKKILIIAFLSVLALPIVAQQNNRIAIYVPEGKTTGVDDETKAYAIAEFIKYFRQGGKYIVVNRSEEFRKAILAEEAYQDAGLVSDRELASFGNEAGVDYICVIVFRKVFKKTNIEARLIDITKGYVIASDNRVINDLSEKTLNNEIAALAGFLTGALGEKGQCGAQQMRGWVILMAMCMATSVATQ